MVAAQGGKAGVPHRQRLHVAAVEPTAACRAPHVQPIGGPVAGPAEAAALDKAQRRSVSGVRRGDLSGSCLRGCSAGNLPSRLNGVRRQIGAAMPFDKVPAIDDLHEFAVVAKVFKRLVLQVGPHVKTALSLIHI